MADTENIHASAVAIAGHGVIIIGSSGSGKSDLALRMIDRGAILVADDRVILRRDENSIQLSAPDNIVGKIEVRNIGILEFPYVTSKLALAIDLEGDPPRLPIDKQFRKFMGLDIPIVTIRALESSAATKVELALKLQNGQ